MCNCKILSQKPKTGNVIKRRNDIIIINLAGVSLNISTEQFHEFSSMIKEAHSNLIENDFQNLLNQGNS